MEITFDSGFADTLRRAFPAEAVLCLPLDWAYGDLRRLAAPTPSAFALQARYGGQSSEALAARLQAAFAVLAQAQAARTPLRVWWRRDADNYGGFLWLCRRLAAGAGPVTHVAVPTRLVEWHEANTLWQYDALGEITPEDAVGLTPRTHPLSQAALQAYGFAGEVASTAPLRVLLADHLLGVEADFYDRFLSAGAKDDEALLAQAMGQGLGVAEWWWRYRLDVLTKAGRSWRREE